MAQILITLGVGGRAQTQIQGLNAAQAHRLLLDVAAGIGDQLWQEVQRQRVETADEAFLKRADQARQSAILASGG